MILCLDVGNSQVYGGIYENGKILFRFRKRSEQAFSSDEFGIFLRNILRENNVDPERIRKISICSVVPDAIHSLVNCSKKYFNVNPFILQSGVKSGLNIKYRNPIEVGADRISNSIGATQMFPNRNLIIIDCGTATTFCAVSKKKDYLGGVIIAGLRISMEALESQTAKLPPVEIVRMEKVLGRSTIESIQSGLYFGHLATIKEITKRLTDECFTNEKPLIIGTGGFSSLFEQENNLFHHIVPDLVLNGLYLAYQMNHEIKKDHSKSTFIGGITNASNHA